jgi:hypothetical protein
MAPAVAETARAAPIASKQAVKDNNKAPRDVFPDGIRTSGQHTPVYEQLKPYSEFPKEISGPTVWKKEDYDGHPERWTHPFSEQEVAEIGKAADDFIASGTPLTGIGKASRQIRVSLTRS